MGILRNVRNEEGLAALKTQIKTFEGILGRCAGARHGADLNQSLENDAGRVADFLEFGSFMIDDALAHQRNPADDTISTPPIRPKEARSQTG
ncbi:MAG: hypothetical protein R2875_02295 [Desulfobacterales bacterium]